MQGTWHGAVPFCHASIVEAETSLAPTKPRLCFGFRSVQIQVCAQIPGHPSVMSVARCVWTRCGFAGPLVSLFFLKSGVLIVVVGSVCKCGHTCTHTPPQQLYRCFFVNIVRGVLSSGYMFLTRRADVHCFPGVLWITHKGRVLCKACLLFFQAARL